MTIWLLTKVVSVAGEERRGDDDVGRGEHASDTELCHKAFVVKREDDRYKAIESDEDHVHERGEDWDLFDGSDDRLEDGECADGLAGGVVETVVETEQREEDVGRGHTGQYGVRLRLKLLRSEDGDKGH